MVKKSSGSRLSFGLFDFINTMIMLMVVCSMIYPFYYLFVVSVSDIKYVMQNQTTLWPQGFNLNAYRIVLGDTDILRGYRNTIMYTLLGTTLSLALTSLTAYALSRKGLAGSRIIIFMIMFTMIFSGGMIPTFLVVKSVGLLDTVWAMIVPGAINTWNLLVMRTFYQGISDELEKAARIDGAGDFGILFKIIIPLSTPVMATIGLFYAVAIWNDFYSALLYLRSSELYPLQVAIRILLEAKTTLQTGGLKDGTVVQTLKFATVIVGTLPILLMYPFIQKYFVNGVMIGSIKG